MLNYSEVKQIVDVSKTSDLMVKYELERDEGHYDLRINGCYVMCLAMYNEIVSRSRPSTYEQVLIGEVLEVLDAAAYSYTAIPPLPHLLSKKVYDDLRSTFERSREAGEAKALALAKKLYLDDFNYMMQTGTWVKIKIANGSSGVLEVRINNKWGYCYSLRFSDGVDLITVECTSAFLDEYFSLFWYFKAWKIRELISLMNESRSIEVTSSIHGAEKETLLKALELALRCETTLGTALFLTARE